MSLSNIHQPPFSYNQNLIIINTNFAVILEASNIFPLHALIKICYTTCIFYNFITCYLPDNYVVCLELGQVD